MEGIRDDRKRRHFLVCHFDSGFISVLIKACLDLEALMRGGGPNQVNHDFPAEQGASPPVGRDMTEHAVLNLVPLARSWWKMAHLDRKAQFV